MARVRIDRQFGAFTWAGLSALRTISVFKIGYVGVVGIPIAAYILRSLSKSGLHLPMTFFGMYVGAILLTLGHLLNEIACPYLIKKFQSLHEFRAHLAASFAHQTAIQQASFSNLRESFQEKLRADQKLAAEDQDHLSNLIADVLVKAGSKSTNQNEEFLDPEADWTKANESRFLLRCTIVTLYAISAVIVSILSVRQAWIVLTATFGNII